MCLAVVEPAKALLFRVSARSFALPD